MHSAFDLQPWIDEVGALASIGSHPHITGYHDSWLEPGQDGGPRQHIKLELCNGGSLGSHVKVRQPLASDELWSICRQMASALKHVHARGWAHLDVKPDNIYRSYEEGQAPGGSRIMLSASPSFNLAQVQNLSLVLTEGDSQNVAPQESSATAAAKLSPSANVPSPCRFVLGDFGLAAPKDGSKGVPEGDSRYLALELLKAGQGSLSLSLDKADMFALGATLYELATGLRLPNEGDRWQALREGRLVVLPAVSQQLQSLIRVRSNALIDLL
jgi:wee1-like protein kinase